MENEADIPRNCQGPEGGVERHGRDMTRTPGQCLDIEATQGGRDAAMKRERERERERETWRERERERERKR